MVVNLKTGDAVERSRSLDRIALDQPYFIQRPCRASTRRAKRFRRRARLYGYAPDANAADRMFDQRPTGVTDAAKTVLGFYRDTTIVGCADFIDGYPESGMAWLGLLLLTEAYQGQGFGSAAFNHIRRMSLERSHRAIRLAVIETNPRALAFWQRHGFVTIDTRDVPGFAARAQILEHAIVDPAGID